MYWGLRVFGKGDGNTLSERPDMPIVIACACGKRLKVPDLLAGKRVKCPACGQLIAVKDAPSPAAADKVKVSCACGVVLNAPKRMLGMEVKCPKCSMFVRIEEEGEGALAPPAAGGAAPPEGASGASLSALADEGEAEDEQGYQKPKCVACKAEMNFGDVICLKCGANQATGEKVEAFEGEVEKEKPAHKAGMPPMALIAVVVAVFVLALAAIVYFQFLRSENGNAPLPQEQTEAPATRPRERTARAPREPAPRPDPVPDDAEEVEVVQPARVFGDDTEWPLERYVYAPRRAEDRMVLLNANRALQMFRDAEGRAPESLDEVEQKGYGPLPKPSGHDIELAIHPQRGEVVFIRRR